MELIAFPPTILLGAFLSTLNLILICLPGVYFARQGLVSKDMRRSLGYMSFNFLLPTLTFVNIAPQLTASKLVNWWPLAVNIIVSRLVALLTGWASSHVPGTKPEHRKIVVAASAFGNTNSALLMLVTAMCSQQHLPFFGALGDQCVTNGYAYVAIGLAASSFLTFPVAVAILKPKPPKTAPLPLPPAEEKPSKAEADADSSLQEIVIAGQPSPSCADGDAKTHAAEPPSKLRPRFSENARGAALTSSVSAPVAAPAPAREEPPSPFSSWQRAGQALGWQADGAREAHAFERMNSLNARRAMLAVSLPEDAEERQPAPVKEVELIEAQNSGKPSPGARSAAAIQMERMRMRIRGWQETRVGKVVSWALTWFNKIMPPPTIASLAGLVVGCVPFLKNIMFPAASAPLGFITTALNTIADAFVFLISFILGAVLQKGPGPGTRSLGWLPLLMTVLNRFLFLPALGAVWVFGSLKLGWWKQPDPLFTFVMLMTNATPTGNQIQAVCAMYHSCEKECGSALFWQYMVSIFGIAIWMVIYIYLMGIFGLL